jgi:hypothetical protein
VNLLALSQNTFCEWNHSRPAFQLNRRRFSSLLVGKEENKVLVLGGTGPLLHLKAPFEGTLFLRLIEEQGSS